MTTEERYPNFAKLTALLNQQEHPRQTLEMVIALAKLGTGEEMFERLTQGNKELVIAAIEELIRQQDGEEVRK